MVLSYIYEYGDIADFITIVYSDIFKILLEESLCSWSFQCKESVTNISKLSPT